MGKTAKNTACATLIPAAQYPINDKSINSYSTGVTAHKRYSLYTVRFVCAVRSCT